MKKRQGTRPLGGEEGRAELDRALQVKPQAFTVTKNKDDVQMVPVGGLITKGMNSTAGLFHFFFNQEDGNLASEKVIAVIRANLKKGIQAWQKVEK